MDLATAIARMEELAAQVAALQQALAERDKALAERDKALAERDKALARLQQRVAELEEQQGSNSSNSGKPPSSDSPKERDVRRKRRARRRKGGSGRRKRGGQPGHKGARRELVPADQVDATERLRSLGPCACGASLDGAEVVGVHRHQVWELPALKADVTEYQLEECCCGACGARVRATLPEGVSSSSFGPRLTAWVAMLTGAYHLSRRRTRDLLRDLLGIRISTGAISACERRVSQALAGPVHEAWAAVHDTSVKHVDASTWWLGTQRLHLWVVATTLLSVFVTTVRGTRDAVRSVLGHRKDGTVVCDRATVFNDRVGTSRQTCWAHLLRYFEAMRKRAGPSRTIGHELLTQALGMFSAWHQVKAGEVSRAEFRRRMEPFKQEFRAILQRGRSCTNKKTAGTCGDILDQHWDALWTFVIVEGVEPTNNHAERELRRAVLWRRTSHASQSDMGLSFVERMMTVVQSLRKQGEQVHTFIARALLAHRRGEPHPSLLPRGIRTP